MPADDAYPTFADLLDNEESYVSRWCEVTDFHGVRFYRSHVLPTHLFNFVTRLWRFPEGASLLDHIEQHYGAPSLPHRLFLGPKEPQDLAAFFASHGYSPLSERLILVHDLTRMPRIASPHVRVKEVTQPAEFQAWVRVALKSWRHPRFPQDFDRVVSAIVSSGVAAGDFTCYLATIDGRWVGTGLMNRTGQLAGIHAITTIPSARGQGAASAIIARILADAAAQDRAPVCLQTGKGDGADILYQRMGFRTLYTLAKYGPPH